MSAYAPYLTCHELGFEMGHRWLFKDLSFAVHPGERWGVVGPNGAGKSTFFKLLAGALKPDEGVVAVRNSVRVATVTQNFSFDPKVTVVTHLKKSFGFDDGTRVKKLEDELTVLGEKASLDEKLLNDKGWNNRVAAIQAELEDLEGISAENLIESILKIGRLEGLENRLLSELSGGQQKRVQIISALLSQPQLILLDEPTNHLDVETVEWLEEFLLEVAEEGVGLLGMRQKHSQEEPFAFVIISHDRALLDTLVNEVLEIADGKTKAYHGNFEAYMEQKILNDIAAEKQVARMSNLFRRELAWLRSGTKARTTKQTARIERAQSLGKTLGTDKHAVAPKKQVEASFQSQLTSFQRNEDDQFVPIVRSLGSQQLVVLKDVDLPYPGNRPKHFVAKNLNLSIRAGQRLALLGPNGCGKTTLMKMIVGELTPTRGEIVNHELIKFAYFDQARANLPEDQTVRNIIAPRGDSVTLHGRQIHVMSYFDRFLFTKGDSEKLVRELSGGERARLLLARLMLEDANFLILDEPTNDLDISTLQALEQNLTDFKGAIVFTSHDRYFLQKVATDLLVFSGEQTNHKDGSIVAKWEIFVDFEQALESATATKAVELRATRLDSMEISTASVAQSEPKKANKPSYKETREFEQVEKRIAELEQIISKKTSELDAAYLKTTDFNVASKLSVEIKDAQSELATVTKRWEVLFDKMS